MCYMVIMTDGETDLRYFLNRICFMCKKFNNRNFSIENHTKNNEWKP